MVASLSELLDVNVRRWPERAALTCGARTLNWSALAERAGGVAGALVDAGLVAQQRVFYVGRNSLAFVEALFGAALADLIFVPLNWRLTPAEIAEILRDVPDPLVVVEPEFDELVKHTVALLEGGCTVVHADLVNGELTLGGWAHATHAAGAVRTTQPDHIAVQLYTSGTTGRPKGAMFANATNIATLLDRVSEAWDLRDDDVSLAVLPLFHMGGLAWLLTSMARGARVVLADFDAARVLDTCEAERVTTAFFVPAMLGLLVTAAEERPRSLTLRRLTYSGAPIAPHALEAAMARFGCDFVQIYGMTEATGAFAQLEPGDHDPGGPREGLLLSAGRPYPWTETRVVDPASGEPVAPGSVGEIWTRSAQNMHGYFHRPEETAAAITPDGWLRTGDIGRQNEDGYLFLLDRSKNVIITGGENIYPAEVEKILLQHPDIAEVAIVGAPDDLWGETVVAVVVPSPGSHDRASEQLTAADVIAFSRDHMAAFKCPRRVDFVATMPRTATGKIQKNVVRDRYWGSLERRIH